MSVSMIASFPLMFAGFRDSLLALARAAAVASDATLSSSAVHRAIVGVGLAAVTAAAVATPDASFVVGLLGALFGSLLIYSLPPVLHLLSGAAPLRSLAGLADVSLVLFGLALATLGTRGALAGQMSTRRSDQALHAHIECAIRRFARPGLLERRRRRRMETAVRGAPALIFGAELSPEDRAVVHSLAERYRLCHRSHGEGNERFVLVSMQGRGQSGG